MGEADADDQAGELEHRDESGDGPIDEAVPQGAERAGGGGDDLQHLARGDGGQRGVAEDDHQRNGEQRAARAGEARAEAGGSADDAEEDLLARAAAAVAVTAGDFQGNQDVETGGDDDEGDDDAERARVDERGGAGAEIAHYDGTGANGHPDAPVHGATALV